MGFVIFYALLITILLLIVQPIKNRTWNNVLRLGDDALANRQFSDAKLQYTKLRLIHPTSPIPGQLIDRANKAEKNILILRDFYASRNDQKMVSLIDMATADYSTPEVATATCQELLKQNEPQLALVCTKKTTSRWPRYRDGWLTQVSVSRAVGDNALAESSLQQVIALDPTALK